MPHPAGCQHQRIDRIIDRQHIGMRNHITRAYNGEFVIIRPPVDVCKTDVLIVALKTVHIDEHNMVVDAPARRHPVIPIVGTGEAGNAVIGTCIECQPFAVVCADPASEGLVSGRPEHVAVNTRIKIIVTPNRGNIQVEPIGLKGAGYPTYLGIHSG